MISRRELAKYGAAAAMLGLAPLGATLEGSTASADNPRLIDFAERRIAPNDIAAAGYAGVVNYVSESRPGANFEAKPLTRGYADALRAAGLHIVSNFQYGKPGGTAPSDFTRGFDGGVADAHAALALHTAAGGSDSAPIFFSVDDDINARHLEQPGSQLVSRNKHDIGCAAHWDLRARAGLPLGN